MLATLITPGKMVPNLEWENQISWFQTLTLKVLSCDLLIYSASYFLSFVIMILQGDLCFQKYSRSGWTPRPLPRPHTHLVSRDPRILLFLPGIREFKVRRVQRIPWPDIYQCPLNLSLEITEYMTNLLIYQISSVSSEAGDRGPAQPPRDHGKVRYDK